MASRPSVIGDNFPQVLRAAQLGASWAATRLYDTTAGAVAGYLRAQDAEDPDGLTNAVFLGVFTNLSGFAGDEPAFRSWVFTIAHRRLTDERRRLARRPRLSPMSPSDERHHARGDVEDDVAARMGADRVAAMIDRLPPDQRDVLLLRVLADLTVEQVAALVAKSPGAVKALQRRGLDGLRKIFSVEGVPL
jgi:RNA polymerase sigma-70 factor (ECF subfamily)